MDFYSESRVFFTSIGESDKILLLKKKGYTIEKVPVFNDKGYGIGVVKELDKYYAFNSDTRDEFELLKMSRVVNERSDEFFIKNFTLTWYISMRYLNQYIK